VTAFKSGIGEGVETILRAIAESAVNFQVLSLKALKLAKQYNFFDWF
jgi:hypothetical protein